MPDQTIYIIRHGEKPQPDCPDPGLTAEGTVDPNSLVIRGWQRAGTWAVLFGSDPAGSVLRPDAIHACAHATQPDGSSPSKRPWETVVPLAARLGLDPDVSRAQGEEASLVDAVMAQDGVALICWEHRLIMTGILARLPIDPATPVPGRWKGHRFDVVFRLQRNRGEASYRFAQLTPCLLDGDKDHPMH